MSNVDTALQLFKERFNCAQAVFAAYAPALGVERETALKMATAFGGGMGRLGATCGAVTGAFMVIGLQHGMVDAADQAAKEKTYAVVREFAAQFKTRRGFITCRDLLGCDIGTPAGMKLMQERQLHTTLCPRLIQDAAEILEQLLPAA